MSEPDASPKRSPAATPPRLLHAPRRLRNLLIDPRFQLRYTGLLVGAALILFVAVGGVLYRTASVAAREAQAAVELAALAAEQAERAFEESQTSARVLRLQRMAETAGDPAVTRAMEAELEFVDRHFREEITKVHRRREQARQQRQRLDAQQGRLLGLVALGGVFFALGLAGIGVVFTHRIAGPVFRLKQLCWKVSHGELEALENLRKGDELQDLHEAFVTMVAGIRARQANEVVTLDTAIRRLAREHPGEAGILALRRVLAEMRKDLGSDEAGRPSAELVARVAPPVSDAKDDSGGPRNQS